MQARGIYLTAQACKRVDTSPSRGGVCSKARPAKAVTTQKAIVDGAKALPASASSITAQSVDGASASAISAQSGITAGSSTVKLCVSLALHLPLRCYTQE